MLSDSVSVISVVVRLASLMAIDFNDITYSVYIGRALDGPGARTSHHLREHACSETGAVQGLPQSAPGLSNKRSYGVFDPQTFERLEGQAIYPLGEVTRDHRAEVSSGDDCNHQTRNQHSARSIDEESNESEQILPKNASHPGGIMVRQDFQLRY